MTNDLLLYDFDNGEVKLQYEKAYNHLVRCNQEYIRDKYESLILSRFKEMRSLGRERTLDISMTNLAIIKRKRKCHFPIGYDGMKNGTLSRRLKFSS